MFVFLRLMFFCDKTTFLESSNSNAPLKNSYLETASNAVSVIRTTSVKESKNVLTVVANNTYELVCLVHSLDLDLMTLIKSKYSFSLKKDCPIWVTSMNTLILKDLKQNNELNLPILLANNFVFVKNFYFSEDQSFSIKEAFLHYFLTVLSSYSKDLLYNETNIRIHILYDINIEDTLKNMFDGIQSIEYLTYFHGLRLDLFAENAFPNFLIWNKILHKKYKKCPPSLKTLNYFVFFMYYWFLKTESLEIYSAFKLKIINLTNKKQKYSQKDRINILKLLCEQNLNTKSYFEVFRVLTFLQQHNISFKILKQIESTILFIVLLECFYQNYCLYYQKILNYPHCSNSQSIQNKQCNMVVMYASHDVKNHTFIIPYDVNNMILQTMYLSRILLFSMIYDTKQHPDSLPEFKLFLYAIHLKVQYFHSKLLPEISTEISDSEKDFLNVSSSNYESLYRYLTT